MRVVKFRVVPDVEEDVFRDIQIGADKTLEDLYRAIINTFSFRGDQLASFYLSNENWDRGHEISVMDMGGMPGELPTVMREAVIGDLVQEKEQKLILVYDFLKMWCFFVEALSVSDEAESGDPAVVLAFGTAPNEDDKEIPDLMDGIDMGEPQQPEDKGTGDAEMDQLLKELDDEDEEGSGETFENIDDLDI